MTLHNLKNYLLTISSREKRLPAHMCSFLLNTRHTEWSMRKCHRLQGCHRKNQEENKQRKFTKKVCDFRLPGNFLYGSEVHIAAISVHRKNS